MSGSPFLLNATIDHHMKNFEFDDQHFISKFLQSIYMNDVMAGALDVQSAYEFYIKAKLCLAEASFNLRKFATNSPELRQRISDNGQSLYVRGKSSEGFKPPCAKEALPESTKRQVLGVRWDTEGDRLIFDVSDFACLMRGVQPTKRNAVSVGTRFFDPLGVMMPITVHFKLLFQLVCERTAGWDDSLMEEALAAWKGLKLDLQHLDTVVLPQCCIPTQLNWTSEVLLAL